MKTKSIIKLLHESRDKILARWILKYGTAIGFQDWFNFQISLAVKNK